MKMRSPRVASFALYKQNSSILALTKCLKYAIIDSWLKSWPGPPSGVTAKE